MQLIGPLGFTFPWLLLALAALPVLWILLRAVPPSPVRKKFPGVTLLLGMKDDDTQTDRTPWWLLLLRLLAIAAAIIGFAGPVLNPKVGGEDHGPLLIVLDGTWADAPDWNKRLDRIELLLDDASALGRQTAVVSLTDLPAESGLPFRAADAWRSSLPGFAPRPWEPDADQLATWLGSLEPNFDTFWLSDGIDWAWRNSTLSAFHKHGEVTVFETALSAFGLHPVGITDGVMNIQVARSRIDREESATIEAHGLDPSGTSRRLASATVSFALGEGLAGAELSVPAELRNRITRFQIAGHASAAAVTLTDDRLRRREIAIISPVADREGLQLLSPAHFLEQALIANSDLIEGSIPDIVLANPDVIILADVVTLAGSEAVALEEWVRKGGLLLRFAGPRLAASDYSRTEEDVLMPVRLRAGGRSVGGAMSWGEPKALRQFTAESPFFGLKVPDDVVVTSQVMAQPDPTLAERTIATLADGTPLVTRKSLDQGQVVLFHVTANAEWSSLALSGLFVQMLERLSVSTSSDALTEEDMEGTIWTPDQVMDAFGTVIPADSLPGIEGVRLVTERPGPDLPPGLYAGEERRVAFNVTEADAELAAMVWPDDVPVEGFQVPDEVPLQGLLLTMGIILLMSDVLATLWLSGRMSGGALRASIAIMAVLCFAPTEGFAQDEVDIEKILSASSEVSLAYIITGDTRLDSTSAAGLRGLSEVLFRRTSIEPGEPHGVNLELDELSVYPFLYWPVTPDQPRPSHEAYERLNRYLRTGGLILFDTRDGNTARFGTATPNGRKLQELARNLDIPALEPFPSDHVLTRTFYLLQDFPGRYASRDIWVEASPVDAELVEGMPFRNLNDNVTPVVIGGNDWAAAWAVDEGGRSLYPVGRGFAGERQREVAYRFGVNLIMHVLTGNYKSDQVHVPALLDRLGQ